MESPKQQLKPGYFNQKPLLRSVSTVREMIGLQDSCIQTNQIAALFLEDQSTASDNQEEFIRTLCKKYRVSLGIRDFQYFKSIQYKSYILQTYNLVETFFKELNKDYRYFNNFNEKWKSQLDGKSIDPFNQLIENLDNKKSNDIKSYPEYYLINYYRLIRNSIAHLQESQEEHKKTSKYFSDNLSDKLVFFNENYELNAPNLPDEISFNDFMLYTRAIKYFSNILNDICFPSIENIVITAQNDMVLKKKLSQYNDVKHIGVLLRRINVLKGYFQYNFNCQHQHKTLRDSFCKAYLDSEGINYVNLLD